MSSSKPYFVSGLSLRYTKMWLSFASPGRCGSQTHSQWTSNQFSSHQEKLDQSALRLGSDPRRVLRTGSEVWKEKRSIWYIRKNQWWSSLRDTMNSTCPSSSIALRVSSSGGVDATTKTLPSDNCTAIDLPPKGRNPNRVNALQGLDKTFVSRKKDRTERRWWSCR